MKIINGTVPVITHYYIMGIKFYSSMNKKTIITALITLFILVSCSDDEEPIREQPTEQTVIFFMPWSTNMTPRRVRGQMTDTSCDDVRAAFEDEHPRNMVDACNAYALSVFPFGRDDKKTFRVSTEWVISA